MKVVSKRNFMGKDKDGNKKNFAFGEHYDIPDKIVKEYIANGWVSGSKKK